MTGSLGQAAAEGKQRAKRLRPSGATLVYNKATKLYPESLQCRVSAAPVAGVAMLVCSSGSMDQSVFTSPPPA